MSHRPVTGVIRDRGPVVGQGTVPRGDDTKRATGVTVEERAGDISARPQVQDRDPLNDGAPTRPGTRIQRLLDLSRDAFVETDARSVLTEWNRQAELLFGWSRDEVLGRPLTD